VPNPVHIATVQRGPSDDLLTSLFSAWAPVSWLVAVPLKITSWSSEMVVPVKLLGGPLVGVTPRDGARSLPGATPRDG
jgi:hypothetical protein